MNRCAICDITDDENPKAGVTFYPVDGKHSEARCTECHSTIQENLEDLSINDEDFDFADNSFQTTLPK